jgi:PadR family transcriptional regulator, regulatory protein AphA
MKQTVGEPMRNAHKPPVEIRLSPVSYVVLGMVGLRGPSTPYELKRAAGRSLDYFWPFPHAQLYSEPARLTAAGLLREHREDSGRRRKTYSLTKAGERALRDWLGTPPGQVFEMRDMAVLQLFFSDFMRTEDLIALARAQTRLYRERLSEYQAIAERNAKIPNRARRMASLDLGQRMARAVLAFWIDIADNPPPGPDPTAAKQRKNR